MIVKPRHTECRDCKFFNINRPHRNCLPCGAGEFFEERFVDRDPSENELLNLYAGMFDNDDE